jgi:hypothetical protein
MDLPQWKIDYYTARRLRLEADIALLDAALTAFIANPISSYQLNTGQTQQMVTRASLPSLRTWRDQLQDELFEILGYLNCDSRTVYVRPGF